MADGYQMLMDALNNYGDQTGWNTRNKLAPIDWGGSFSKWFGKKQPQTEYTPNPNVPQNMSSILSGAADGLPAQTETSQPQYSADNPYGQYMPSGKTFFAYKSSPELTGLAGQWEQDKKDKDMARAFQEAQQNDYNGQYINLDQNTFNQLPEQLRGLYQVGGRYKRDEIAGLMPSNSGAFTYDPQTLNTFASGLDNRNPLKKVFATFGPNTPAAQIEKAMQEATNYQNYLLDYDKQGAGSDKGNIDLTRQYQGVLDAYEKYKSGVAARKTSEGVTPSTTPLGMTDWLRQPDQAGLLNTYNLYNGTNLKSLPAPFSTKVPGQNPPSGTTASNANTQQSGWFKTHSTPPPGVNPSDWSGADWVLMNLPKGVPQSISGVVSYYKNKIGNGSGQIPQNIYNALVARLNYGKNQNVAGGKKTSSGKG